MTTATKKRSKKLDKIMNNFELFSKNFIHIIDNNNDKIKLDLNDAQIELNDLMSENRFVIVSKARQGGISTFTLAKALYRAITETNENILIVSYKGDSALALFEMLKRMNEWLPRDKYSDLFPETRRDNRGELLFDNGSRITSVTAGNKSIGRGSTYSYIHMSEFAFYSRQEMQLLSAEQSLMKGEGSQLSIETTSNGINNLYYKLFMNAYKGNSKYKAMFIPFFHPLYKKQFKHDHDEAEKWYKEDSKGQRLSKNDLEPDEKVLFENGANYKFLMWRRWKLLDMSLEDFKQEYPSNPMESFISTGQSVFDNAKVLERVNSVIQPLDRNEVVSELPTLLHKFINRGLVIFHLPKRTERYYGGVDVASGGGGDNSTLSLFDSEGQQVLSFYHNKVPVYQFAEILNEIGRMYNYTFIAVERNSYGLPLLERLRKDYKYMNLYKQKMFNEFGKKSMQLGFTTSAQSKSILISDYKESFELNFINVECKETLSQMQIYQENANGSMGNKRGEQNFDDLVISAALSVQARKANKWYVE
ncbi:DNA packaging protein [Virgibacillus natechei]